MLASCSSSATTASAAASSTRRSCWCRACHLEASNASRRKHPERYRRTPEQEKARTEKRRSACQTTEKLAEKARKERAYFQTPRGKAIKARVTARRRERESRRVWADQLDDSLPCPICGEPIVGDRHLGHEPPLAREEIPGPGVRRWEHPDCNIRKHTRLDSEMSIP